MAKEIICYADDATGALDVAGAFYSRGYEATVALEAEISDDLDSNCRVYAQNSRYDSPAESKEKLASALSRIDKDLLSQINLFLKVDSTLRGNVLGNLDQISDFVNGRPIFLAPSLPLFGRTCVDGHYLVNGVPILETEFAKDSAFKYISSALNDNRVDIEHIDWRTLSHGPNAVADRVSSSGAKKFSFDTKDEDDLSVIVQTGLLIQAIMVGSQGLARALPNVGFQQSQEFIPDTSLPTLFVVGSLHKITRVQKTKLAKVGISGIDIGDGNLGNITELQAINYQIKENLSNGVTTYLSTPDIPRNDAGIWREMEEAIQEVTLVNEVPHNLVIVGGETARATFKGRQISTIAIKSEYEPGVPISSQKGQHEAILTKAGSFGHSNTLVDIYHFLNKGYERRI